VSSPLSDHHSPLLSIPTVPTPIPETPVPLGSADLRTSVLHLQGSPITQLSTSRLFAYLTHFGTSPLGLEWVSDHSCNVVFSDFESSREALTLLLSQEEYDDISTSAQSLIPEVEKLNKGDGKDLHEKTVESLLTTRKAKRLPGKLYNAKEKDIALKYSEMEDRLFEEEGNQDQEMESQLPEDVPEIYRDFEKADKAKQREEYEAGMGGELKILKSLRGTLFVRFACASSDVKHKKSRETSKWYQKYGKDAGKEVVGRLLQVGEIGERRELLGHSGEALERSKREIDRKKLDVELDGMMVNREDGIEGEAIDPDYFERQKPRRSNRGTELLSDRISGGFRSSSHNMSSGSGSGNASGSKIRVGWKSDLEGKDLLEARDLDDQLGDVQARRRERSASPNSTRRNFNYNYNDNSHNQSSKARGRGGTRAPSKIWDGDQEDDQTMRVGNGPFRSHMMADELEARQSRKGRNGNGRGMDRWERDQREDSNDAISSSGGKKKGRDPLTSPEQDLASRFGPVPGTLRLESRLSAWGAKQE